MLEGLVQRSRQNATPNPPDSLAEPFVFVPVTGDEAAKGRGAAKRIVRAHVTRMQHARSSTLSATQSLQMWTVRPYIHHDVASGKRRCNKSKSSLDTSRIEDWEKAEGPPIECEPEQWVPRLPTGSHLEDPFWTFPIDYEPQLAPIITHYVQNLAVDNPDLDGPSHKGLLRSVWFPLAMTETSTMYALLLMAASHYCTLNPSEASRVNLLRLKARALSGINRALADPKQATTDATVGAVMKMAAYEAIFGDSDVFAAHMQGLALILKIRGGFSELGLDGLLERMLVWIDLNAAHLTGLDRSLVGDAFPTAVSFATPDPHHFAGMS